MTGVICTYGVTVNTPLPARQLGWGASCMDSETQLEVEVPAAGAHCRACLLIGCRDCSDGQITNQTRSTQRAQTSAEHGMTQIRLQFFLVIRGIRILDFGLPDPKRDPDRHQNCITWSLSHALPLQKFRENPFTSLRVIRRTDRQTDRTKNITSFFGGGNHKSISQKLPIFENV